MLKGKVSGGDEVRTQTCAKWRRWKEGKGGSQGRNGGKISTFGFITTRVQPRVQSIMKASDKNPSLTHDSTNNNEQEQRSWSTLSLLGVWTWPWVSICSHVWWKLSQAIQVLVVVFAWHLWCLCDVFTVFVWHLYCVCVTSAVFVWLSYVHAASLLCSCHIFAVFVWCLSYIRMTSLWCSCDIFAVLTWHICGVRVTSLLCSCDIFAVFAWWFSYVCVTSLLCTCDIFTVFVWCLCCVCVTCYLFLWWLVSLANTKSSTHTTLPLFNNFHWALHTNFSDPNKKSSRSRFISSQKTKQVFLTLSPRWL